MSGTPTQLVDATVAQIREHGLTSVSARTVAARAGLNQALVFYHFGSVAGLVDAASRTAVQQSTAFYEERLSAAGSLGELLEIARTLNERERSLGNVTMMAQLMAAGQHDPATAATAAWAMTRWQQVLLPTVTRVLGDHPLGDVVDPEPITQAVSAAFIGLALYDGIDSTAAGSAFAALDSVAALVDALASLNPVTQRAVRTSVRRIRGRTHR